MACSRNSVMASRPGMSATRSRGVRPRFVNTCGEAPWLRRKEIKGAVETSTAKCKGVQPPNTLISLSLGVIRSCTYDDHGHLGALR